MLIIREKRLLVESLVSNAEYIQDAAEVTLRPPRRKEIFPYLTPFPKPQYVVLSFILTQDAHKGSSQISRVGTTYEEVGSG
jgi:hypothetical protein